MLRCDVRRQSSVLTEQRQHRYCHTATSSRHQSSKGFKHAARGVLIGSSSRQYFPFLGMVFYKNKQILTVVVTYCCCVGSHFSHNSVLF